MPLDVEAVPTTVTPKVAIEDVTKYYGQTLVLDEVFVDVA